MDSLLGLGAAGVGHQQGAVELQEHVAHLGVAKGDSS